jgi:hypothetical protein
VTCFSAVLLTGSFNGVVVSSSFFATLTARLSGPAPLLGNVNATFLQVYP